MGFKTICDFSFTPILHVFSQWIRCLEMSHKITDYFLWEDSEIRLFPLIWEINSPRIPWLEKRLHFQVNFQDKWESSKENRITKYMRTLIYPSHTIHTPLMHAHTTHFLAHLRANVVSFLERSQYLASSDQ